MKKNLFMAAVFLLMAAGLKTTAQPNIQWLKNYGGLNTDKAYSIKQLPDNGYIVVGESNSNSGDVSGFHGGIDYWVARLDPAGNIVWQRSYGGSHNDIAISVDLTNDGGFIIAGSSDSQDGDVTDHPNGYTVFDCAVCGGDYPYYPDVLTWLVKIDGAGNINWTKTFAFSIFLEPYNGGSIIYRYPINHPGKIIQTSDGGYLLSLKKEAVPGDYIYVGVGGDTEQEVIPYLIKLTSNGDIVWTNDFPSLQPEILGIRTLLETSDGYVFMATPTFLEDGNVDIYIVKVNFSGILQSSRKYGGSGADKGISIAATTDGGYIVTGTTDSDDQDLTGVTHHGSADYWVLKLNSAGDVQWSKLYGGSQDDIPTTVIQAQDGNYVVAGTSKSDDQQVTGHTPSAAGEPANSDMWVIKINGSNGDLIWSSSYGGDKDETGNDLVKTSDGGLIVAGSSFSSFGNIINKGDADWLLIKLNERVNGIYCSAKGVCDKGFIKNVFACYSFNNTTGCTGYGDYTAKAVNTAAGRLLGLSVTPGYNSGNYHPLVYIRAWIDWNGDGDFTDGGELVFAPYAPVNVKAKFWVKVPTGTGTGRKRMRVAVSADKNISSCGTIANGEVEDYSINVLAARFARLAVPDAGPDAFDEAGETFTIYPNPVKGKIIIERSGYDEGKANNAPALMVLTNANGKTLIQSRLVNLVQAVDVSRLPAGVYFVTIINGNNKTTNKIIVNR